MSVIVSMGNLPVGQKVAITATSASLPLTIDTLLVYFSTNAGRINIYIKSSNLELLIGSHGQNSKDSLIIPYNFQLKTGQALVLEALNAGLNYVLTGE